MSTQNNLYFELNMGPVVPLDEVVACGLITFDTCCFMHPGAEAFFDRLDAELKRQDSYIWQSADARSELEHISQNVTKPSDVRQKAANGLRIFDRLWSNGVLACFSETPEATSVSENKDVPSFLDNVIVSRVRMYGGQVPMVVVTLDGNLARTLLWELPCDCSRKGAPVRVFRLDDGGQLHELRLKPKVQPQTQTARPLSLLAPLTNIEDAPIPRGHVTGEVTGARSSKRYTLGDMLGEGAEAMVFSVREDEGLCVKLFWNPSIWKAKKISLLVDLQPRISDAAVPIEEILGPEGDFVGYVMPKLSGVPIEALFSARSQMRHAPDWSRVEYTRVGVAVLRRVEELLSRGILPGDISGKNFLVAKENGVLQPDRVLLLDLDSAQFGNAETGVIPANGYTEEYCTPEYLRDGIPQKRSVNSVVYAVLLVAVQLVLGGVHPFRVSVEEGGDGLTVADAIRAEKFPFGAGDVRRQACAAKGAELLWSHSTRAFKGFISDVFRKNGALNAPEARPGIQEAIKQFEKLLFWMENSDHPEDRSLNPTSFRCYMVTCKKCGKKFNANAASVSAQARNLVICDECLDEACGTCQACGKPLDMTLREMYKHNLKQAPKMCKSCHIAAKAAPKAELSYRKCGVCGQAYRAQLSGCPHCAAASGTQAAASAAGTQAKATPPLVTAPVHTIPARSRVQEMKSRLQSCIQSLLHD